MILTEKLKIKVSKMNIKHLILKGYVCNLKDIIEIKTEDLIHGSHIKIQVKCDICGNEKELSFQKYIKNIKNDSFYACTSKCAQEKVKKTNIKNFGAEYYSQTDECKIKTIETDQKKYGCNHHAQNKEVKEKQKSALIEKYGVDNYFKSEEFKENNKKMLESKGVINNFQLEEVKEKSKITCMEKYGVPYTALCTEIRDIQKMTNLKKYGFIYPSKNIDIKEKVLNTNLKKFGMSSVLISPENKKKAILARNKNWLDNIISNNNNINFLESNSNKEFKILCQKEHEYNISYHLFYMRNIFKTELCTICNPIEKHISGLEFQLYDFINENYDNEIIQNSKKIISPLELDIYLPELKLAFEFNGLFWHNEINKENNYHLNKTELCEEKDIQLIHIYEDDWLYKQDIIKSMILNKLNLTPNKIYARKTEIKEVTDNKLVREFLNQNHIQGFVGSKVKLGLYYDNELVSLMTFGNLRIAMGKKTTKENEYELLRFCNKLNTNIIGGASKLFKYFINNYAPNEITTYADRSFSQGKLYETLGFKFKGKTEPNYYYIIDGIKQHRFNFRKDKLVLSGYDINKTEKQIMAERKIYRIYDSGNLRYQFNIL